jgi:hypothetical protein
VRTGVVRFEVAACGGEGAQGSGFELAPTLVATAAHVVDGGQVIRIVQHDLLEMDAATARGSSGGPVIRADGGVVGLVDAGPTNGDPGRRLAVSSATAVPLIDEWTDHPQPTTPPECSGAVDANGVPIPSATTPTRDNVQVGATLDVYFHSINGGDYPTALAQFTPPSSLESFSEGVAGSQDTDLQYRTLTDSGDGLVAWVTFTQSPGGGPGTGGASAGDVLGLVPGLRDGTAERLVAHRRDAAARRHRQLTVHRPDDREPPVGGLTGPRAWAGTHHCGPATSGRPISGRSGCPRWTVASPAVARRG